MKEEVVQPEVGEEQVKEAPAIEEKQDVPTEPE